MTNLPEKKNFYSLTPLMINGKNLIHSQSLKIQTRLHHTNYDKRTLGNSNKELAYIQEVLTKTFDSKSSIIIPEKIKQNLSDVKIKKDSQFFSKIKASSPAFKIPRKLSIKLLKKNLKKPIPRFLSNPFENYRLYLTNLQMSNGLEITKPKRIYKYYIGPGNNESLIHKTLHHKQG